MLLVFYFPICLAGPILISHGSLDRGSRVPIIPENLTVWKFDPFITSLRTPSLKFVIYHVDQDGLDTYLVFQIARQP